MAENQVEIDVVLNAEQAEKGFEKLEEGSKAVGESFGSVVNHLVVLGKLFLLLVVKLIKHLVRSVNHWAVW
jgi:hypothetical protein